MTNNANNAKKSIHDIMTVERLRAHLFGGPQAPFWNYDPKQLTFGVEVEYFIAHTHDDGTFTLATKSEYLQVIEHLKNDFGYQDRKLHDQPGRVSRDTERGFIAIKPDFAWHILEVSFPPRGNLEDLRTLMEKVFFEVDSALAKVGLERLDRSSLPNVPEKMDLVELDRLTSFTTSARQKNGVNPYMDPNFPAYITATHVHLNVLNEDAMKLLAPLYKIEQLTGNSYARPSQFAGITEQNVRDKFMRHTMGENYLLKCVPDPIPGSLREYAELMNRSERMFPNDRFFPVRDVTYIRPTKFGTLEFRSSCSFLAPQKLTEIAGWRALQLLAATDQDFIASDLRENLEFNLNLLLKDKVFKPLTGKLLSTNFSHLKRRDWHDAI